jgi:hypothetical protein
VLNTIQNFESSDNVSGEPLASEEIEIARAILRYLKEHPDAKDTLDGIAQWWLLREWTERRVAEVERAVSFLVAEELVLQTSRTGLLPYYEINNQKVDQISKLLQSP